MQNRFLSTAHGMTLFLLLAVIVLWPAHPVRAQVQLNVEIGAGTDQVDLQWTGGLAKFAVFRSTDPASVDLPGSWLIETNDRQWTDLDASASILYYRVNGEDSCAPGETLCQGVCVDPFNDDANCGACGHTCSVTEASDTFCAGGTCAASCYPGFGDCSQPSPPSADDGCETDLDNDPMSCGACGNVCDPGLTCSFGICS